MQTTVQIQTSIEVTFVSQLAVIFRNQRVRRLPSSLFADQLFFINWLSVHILLLLTNELLQLLVDGADVLTVESLVFEVVVMSPLPATDFKNVTFALLHFSVGDFLVFTARHGPKTAISNRNFLQLSPFALSLLKDETTFGW